MEGAKARAVAAMLIMMLVLVSQAGKITAKSDIPEKLATCYAECFIPCALSSTPITECALKCLEKCLLVQSTTSTSLVDRNSYYCHLGCASSTCSKITTPNNLGAATKDVKGCVNSCSQSCNKHY